MDNKWNLMESKTVNGTIGNIRWYLQEVNTFYNNKLRSCRRASLT